MILWEIVDERACIFSSTGPNLVKFMSFRIVFLYAETYAAGHYGRICVAQLLGRFGMVVDDSSMVAIRPSSI